MIVRMRFSKVKRSCLNVKQLSSNEISMREWRVVPRSHSGDCVSTAGGGWHLLMLPFGPALHSIPGLGWCAGSGLHPVAAMDRGKGEKAEPGGGVFSGYHWIARGGPRRHGLPKSSRNKPPRSPKTSKNKSQPVNGTCVATNIRNSSPSSSGLSSRLVRRKTPQSP